VAGESAQGSEVVVVDVVVSGTELGEVPRVVVVTGTVVLVGAGAVVEVVVVVVLGAPG
jgi:hypothetical protein